MLLGKKEVFMTYQMDAYGKAKQALVEVGIPYDLKTVNSAVRGKGRNMTLGHTLENQGLDMCYYLYVKKTEEERARHVIREAFRQ